MTYSDGVTLNVILEFFFNTIYFNIFKLSDFLRPSFTFVEEEYMFLLFIKIRGSFYNLIL